MKTMTARAAKNGLDLMIDTAHAEPVTIEKYGRAVVVVYSRQKDELTQGGRDGAMGGKT